MSQAARPGSMRNGRFTNLQPLSKGGMGAIYLANEAIATGTRLVVIKEMLDYYDPADPKGHSKAQKRFEAEAITLANLSVPGIPQVFDYFSEAGRYFIVMQYIEGQNLESGLSRLDENGRIVPGKPYPIERVRQWGIELCKMLEGLAAQNIIHMDIKPANLILDRSGRVWLVDFGTAAAGMATAPGAAKPNQAGLHRSSVYGTLGYAAPEQAASKPEARSDVFALAATLYHLATDDDPGAHPLQFPRLKQVPPDLANALKKGLEADVNRRITAPEFGRLIEPRATRVLGFHWQNGATSADPAGLVPLALQFWDEARSYYAGDGWEHWLADIHRHDLVVNLGQTRQQFQDPDVGLDAFLRVLDPNLAPPSLTAQVSIIDVGTVLWRTQQAVDLELHNQGGGCLQARLVNISPGVQLSPAVAKVQNRQKVRLMLDTGSMTPMDRQQIIPVIFDAGPGGRLKIQLKLRIPEPGLTVNPDTLYLGAAYRGQVLQESFVVHNPGVSLFQGQAGSQAPHITIEPVSFEVYPGRDRVVHVRIDTQRDRIGLVNAEIWVRAEAGGWERLRKIKIHWEISIFKTFWKYQAPLLAWVGLGALSAGVAGTLLMTVALDGELIVSVAAGFLGGILLGVLLAALPGMMLGAGGMLDGSYGRDGLRSGGKIGLIIGGFLGGSIGALAGWFGAEAGTFGALVGAGVGGAFGYYAYSRRKQP